MIGLLQRVTQAWIDVAGERIAQIGPGLLVLIAVEPEDDEQKMQRMLERLLAYRVFDDRIRNPDAVPGKIPRWHSCSDFRL